jgi:chitin deacetylase
MKRAGFWLLLCALVLAGAAGLWQISKSRTFQFFGGLVSRVPTSQRVVALTFDDGPLPGNTEKVIQALAAAGVRATFFVTGESLAENPAEGRRLVAAGHELGNHSYSHRRMVLKSGPFIKSEVERTDHLIRQAGYRGEVLFRPPNGKKLLALPYYLRRTGRTTITWDVEPDSYPAVAASSDRIVQYTLDHVRPGSIILLHVMADRRGESRQAIGGIVSGLRQKGYTFLTVSELLRQ